jgi:hypothetical protein
MTIDEMQLAPIAKNAATILITKHPDLEFTSGLRSVRQQAHAMAANIVSLHDRKWIGNTYLAGAKLQAWVETRSTPRKSRPTSRRYQACTNSWIMRVAMSAGMPNSHKRQAASL